MAEVKSITTLPTNSNERKDYALFSGCMRYFPAALAGVSKTSKLGNDKHNPGQEMHHARDKSGDHGDCIMRHLMDLSDLLAANDRGQLDNKNEILTEASSLAWRALALSQELHEKLGSPMAPGARKDKDTVISIIKEVKFQKGDVVKHLDNDIEVTVEGTYFDVKGNPVLFVKDSDNKIFGVDPNSYKSIYVEKK